MVEVVEAPNVVALPNPGRYDAGGFLWNYCWKQMDVGVVVVVVVRRVVIVVAVLTTQMRSADWKMSCCYSVIEEIRRQRVNFHRLVVEHWLVVGQQKYFAHWMDLWSNLMSVILNRNLNLKRNHLFY